MISDELGRQLHDRSTRGESLSIEEEQQLNSWYDQQDEIESRLILSRVTPGRDLSELQTQIEASLSELESVLHRIQKADSIE
jgi:hypothetical protein